MTLCVCLHCPPAVRPGELPQQPVPQLPPLLLRDADDVRLHPPVRAAREAVARRSLRSHHILRLSRPRPSRIQQHVRIIIIIVVVAIPYFVIITDLLL